MYGSADTHLEIIAFLARNPGAKVPEIAAHIHRSDGHTKNLLYKRNWFISTSVYFGTTIWFLTDPGRRVARARGYRLTNDDEF